MNILKVKDSQGNWNDIPAIVGKNGEDYVLTSEDKEEIAGMVEIPVEDVQIDGTSIVQDGVANVPMASNSSLGVLKINLDYGINKYDTGLAFVNKANDTQIKSGTGQYRPIVPVDQYKSVFYGLAKAASDTTQATSSNPVGTYTDEAKIAIQKMLGIYEPPYVLLNDITLEEESNIDLSADANGTPYNLRNVCISIYYATNLANASDGYGRYRFADGNNRYVLTETGKYTTSTSVNFKWIFVNRQGNLTYALYTRQATTGNAGVPYIKSTHNGILNSSSGSVLLDLGNITRIYSPTIDVEPAGTRIQIYGQWAY